MGPDPPPALGSSLARWFASAASSAIHFLALLLVAPFSRRAAWRVYRHWARTAPRIFGITVSVRDDNAHEPPPSPRLYVWLNQSSLTEGPLFATLVPPHNYVINLGYAVLPLLGWARVLLGDVVIVRPWPAQAKRGIERAARRMAAGQPWAISIEGMRSADHRLAPSKEGAVVMAVKSQATIIPVAFHGSRDVMPKGAWRIRPGHVEVRLLRAMPARGLTYEDRDAVLQRLRAVAEVELGPQAAPPAPPGDLPAPPGRA